MTSSRKYTQAQKHAAIRRALEAGPAVASREHDIPSGTMNCWVHKSRNGKPGFVLPDERVGPDNKSDAENKSETDDTSEADDASDGANRAYPKDAKRAKAVIRAGKKALGQQTRRPRQKMRLGTRRKVRRRRWSGFDGSCERLLEEVLRPLLACADRGKKRIIQAIAYIERNLYKLNYDPARTRGFQLGFGAMESLHRTASQVRLKRAGCHWTADAAQAMVNLRLLIMSGR